MNRRVLGSAVSSGRVAVALSACAVLIASTGVTPADAVRSVKRALYAQNAGSVNGIKASRSPTPRRLLPLGADGRFPASVLGSQRGPRGGEGPKGDPGDRGPSDIVTATRNGVTLSTTGPTATDVVTLNNVPPGKWWVLASTSAVYEGPGAVGSDYFRCGLTFGGDGGTAQAVSRVGLDAVGTAAAVLTVHEGRELTSPTSIRLRCGHDITLPSGVPRFDHAQITAIRTASLEIQGG